MTAVSAPYGLMRTLSGIYRHSLADARGSVVEFSAAQSHPKGEGGVWVRTDLKG